MFESTLAPRVPRSRKLAVAVSVGLHVGLGVALLVSSFWRIDRLEARSTPVTFIDVAPPPPPPAAAAPPPPAATHASTRREKPRIPDDVVQPTEAPSEPETVDEPTAVPGGDPDGVAGGIEGGQKGGVVGGDRDGVPGGVPGGLPGSGAPVAPPPSSQIVPAVMLEGARIAGTSQILLPEPVRQVMNGQGIRDTKAVVKLCLSTTGVPEKTSILVSTGFASADARILGEMASWRYRAYVVNGKPVPVCTSIVFQYRLR